jgi:hypothetical protein
VGVSETVSVATPVCVQRGHKQCPWAAGKEESYAGIQQYTFIKSDLTTATAECPIYYQRLIVNPKRMSL